MKKQVYASVVVLGLAACLLPFATDCDGPAIAGVSRGVPAMQQAPDYNAVLVAELPEDAISRPIAPKSLCSNPLYVTEHALEIRQLVNGGLYWDLPVWVTLWNVVGEDAYFWFSPYAFHSMREVHGSNGFQYTLVCLNPAG